MTSDNRDAILKLIKATMLIVVGSIVLLFGVTAAIFYSQQIKINIESFGAVVSLILLFIGAIIELTGASDLYVGFGKIDGVSKVYDLGRYGALAQITASLLLTMGFYFIVFSSNAAEHLLGSGFAFTGYVIGIACAVPVGIAFYSLGKKYGSGIMKSGAVAYVLIPIVGPFILYLGLNGVMHVLGGQRSHRTLH